jgi:hypothetical protein
VPEPNHRARVTSLEKNREVATDEIWRDHGGVVVSQVEVIDGESFQLHVRCLGVVEIP